MKQKPICLFLVFIIIFLMCGCTGYTVIKITDGDSFLEEMEKLELEATDKMLPEYEDTYYNLYEVNHSDIYIQYFYAFDDNTAINLFNNDYEDTAAKVTDNDISEKDSTTSYNIYCVTFSDGRYVYEMQNSGVYIYLECTANGRVIAERFIADIKS